MTTVPISLFLSQFLLVVADGDQSKDIAYTPLEKAAEAVKDKHVRIYALVSRPERETDRNDLTKVVSVSSYVFIRPLVQIQSVAPDIMHSWHMFLQGTAS